MPNGWRQHKRGQIDSVCVFFDLAGQAFFSCKKRNKRTLHFLFAMLN